MKSQLKHLLSSFLVGAMILSSVNGYSVHAEESQSTETIAGQPETINLSSTLGLQRQSNFNDGWKFYLGKSDTAYGVNFDDSSWTNVSLPHDFSITQGFTTSGEAESGFLPGGTGWYRKSFTLSDEMADKTVVLNFDGVYSDAYVYVNGSLIGEHHYGYSSFAFDISDYLTYDGKTENVIAVKVVNNIPSSRWYSGSGIYRDVTLIVTDPVHVAYNGTYVTTPDIASGMGTVHIEADIDNDSDSAKTVTVKHSVYTKEGTLVTSNEGDEISIDANATKKVTQDVTVNSPNLWSPENPNLYYVVTEVIENGATVDQYQTTFGFRYFEFKNDTGFYLNGQALKLNGVCMHHDQGALGAAAYTDAIYRQLSMMKDMGVNAIRTSHNPADKDFINICNELGFLVIEEAFDGWSESKNGNSNDFAQYFSSSIGNGNNLLNSSSSMTWAEYAIKSMVRRDRNDPSVILWSLGNEIQEGAVAANTFPTIAQNLIDYIKEVDTTRPSTIGSNQRTTTGILGSVHSVVRNNGGIVGFNYASASELLSMHSTYGPIIAAETSSAVNSRGIYNSQANASNADGKYHLTSYDTSMVSWGKTAHDSMWDTLGLDYVAGEFVWTGFDYIGEPTPWNGTGSGSVSRSGAIPNSSYFGIVDTAGFEKDTYYLYRSQWNQKDTTLHLVTSWDSDNMLTTSGKTPVVIYSNAPKVELYRNGTLIGTATRKTNTTVAGHTYYTYTTTSNNSSICSAVNASGSASLYASFNVTYASGTISAKAYDESGALISTTKGNNSVSTPAAVSQLKVTTNKTAINADGSSLAYISVEVLDSKGNLDTTATNLINFSLTGNGEIVGVDNGDQATTAKYQQSSVLTSSTSAKIAAYAGKALVIIKSTKDAGTFNVDVSSSGLTGGSVSIKTNEVGNSSEHEGLISYTMVRDYSIKVGTIPTLQTTATGMTSDGKTLEGTISWETIDESIYQNAGDYIIKGKLTFIGYDDIDVTCKLHVIPEIVALRNISTVTSANTVPSLPASVYGITADGQLSGEYQVKWDNMTDDMFVTVGETVVISGTAVVLDQELPVTANVRVAEIVNTESINVAPNTSSLTQDIAEDKQSDNLNSINNGITKPGDNTNERWSNWNNRTIADTAVLTFTWDTAQLLNSVNLYYYYDNCAAKPDSVRFEYSLNGTDYLSIESTEELIEDYSLGAEYSYTFTQTINPVALRIIFTQQNGTSGSNCVALTEAEIMTFAGQLEYNTNAALSGIAVNGTTVDNFVSDQLTYEVSVASASDVNVTAQGEDNVAVTILPVYNNTIRILTLSEDAQTSTTYVVTLEETTPPTCIHEHTEIINQHDASCTEDGYTGDTYCTDCKNIIQNGQTIFATGHNTEIINAKEATCTEDGYTGDEVCTVCGVTVSKGAVIAAKGHTYDNGVITKQPTETEEGIKTYTCTICGETKTESIPVTMTQTAPSVSLSVARAATSGKIRLTGLFEDYENISKYYEVTAHGLVYISSSKLGTRNLTVNTAGRTRVNFSSYNSDGSFSYTMKPAFASTRYTVRAFLAYKDEYGRTIYVYSNPITVSYNALK